MWSNKGSDPFVEEFLLAHVLKKDRAFVLAHPELKLTTLQRKSYVALLKRHKKGEPLAYLLGSQPFYSHSFFVNKDVLIPRPETEWLIEEARRTLNMHREISTVIDVGTGSGCILLSVLQSEDGTKKKALRAYGIDTSDRALAVAKKNAEQLNIAGIVWKKGNLLAPIKHSLTPKSSVLLLANLPYLTTKDYEETPAMVKKYEPKIALAAGKEGLDYYRPLIKQLSALGDINWYALWEIDPCHAKKLLALVEKTFPSVKANLARDLNGHYRYLTWSNA